MHKRLMIVDDEAFIISSMALMFSNMEIDTQHHIDSCTNGQESFDTFKLSMDYEIQYAIIF